jgi:CRISPR/Cas system-associated protein Cas7 (RAMP superfamily)
MEKDGYKVTEYKVGNSTVFVYSPILTEEEKTKREKAAVRALAAFGREMHKSKMGRTN